MQAPDRCRTGRTPWSRWLLASLFVVAGVFHFLIPSTYRAIVPRWLPQPALLVAISGACEIVGGLGLLSAATRRSAGWGLIALLVAVFPANIQMLQEARSAGASALWQAALWARLPLQLLLIYWVWRVAVQRPHQTT